MKRLLSLVVIAVFAAAGFGQTPAGFDLANYGVRIDPDKRLLAVLATLNMAGARNADGKMEPTLNPPLSPEGLKFRERLWADTADLPVDLRQRITNFVTQYKRRNAQRTDAEIIAPFISMAYTLTDAPALEDPVVTSDLPGDLLDVLDFAPLVRELYRRSAIASKMDGYVKEYRLVADRTLRPSTRDMVSEMLGYLHTRPMLTIAERVKVETGKQGSKKQTVAGLETRQHDRHFYVVPEALAPKGTLNFLNIRDDYYLIVPPDTDLSFSEARRAYLRFVIDPLILQNSRDLGAIRDWAKPILDDLRKKNANVTPDPFLSMSRSLVAAVDIRQRYFTSSRIATNQARGKITAVDLEENQKKIDRETAAERRRQIAGELTKLRGAIEDERALELYEEYMQGNILSFYFADELVGVEESGFDIAASIKEMIVSFDPAKQAKYIDATEEARKRAAVARADRRTTVGTIVAENPVTAKLLDIQKTIGSGDLNKAAADLKALLAENPSEPRIYYNIGRVAGLAAAKLDDQDAQMAKLIEAKTAYSNVLRTATADTDKVLLSLTFFALGRIYEFGGENEYAVKLYDQAIKLDNVTGGAYNDAIAAKQRLLKP